jgi:hypothetical protein
MPYLADVQKSHATLIGRIIALEPQVARDTLSVLPPAQNDPQGFLSQLAAVVDASDERTKREAVFLLLREVRGMNIHEFGKLKKSGLDRRKVIRRNAGEGDEEGMEGVNEQARIVRGGEESLEGVAGLF